jgi:hypothetical protein
LDEDEDEDEDVMDGRLRVYVHCGKNFYLGSAFYVKVEWGSK